MADRGAQIDVKSKILKCPNHEGMEVVFVCEECSDMFACVNCVTSVHKKHNLIDLRDFIQTKKESLQTYVEQTVNSEIPEITRLIEESEGKLGTIKRESEENFQKIKERGVLLKRIIDELMESFEYEQSKSNSTNDEVFRKFKTELLCNLTYKENAVKCCRTALESSYGADVMHALKMISSKPIGILDDFTDSPVFVRSDFSYQKFSCNIMSELDQVMNLPEGENESKEIHEEAEEATEDDNIEAHFAADHYEHNEKPKSIIPRKAQVLSTFSGFESEFMASTEYSEVWVGKGSRCVALVDRTGTLIKEIKSDSLIKDIGYFQDTKALLLCCEDGSVKEITSGSQQIIIKMDQSPKCVCVTSDGSILLGIENAVAKYDDQGTILSSTYTDSQGDKIVTNPYRISESPCNSNIAVVDVREKSPCVVVLNTMRLIFKFLGTFLTSSENISSKTGYKRGYFPFNPRSLCYNGMGNLLVADYDNRQIIALNDHGEFLLTIHFTVQHPNAMCVQNNGLIWVAGHNGKIEILELSAQ